MREKTQKSFLSGVLLLTISTISVKIIGLIYKIPMLAYLGTEGMGYFNSAYEIYALFCIISTAGLPVALSVLISGAVAKEREDDVPRIYRAAFLIFFCVGILGSGIMVFFARSFCNMIQSENAYYSILSIAPTVLFICISSALRGYFQGYQRMLPTAVSQILESIGKLVFGLLFASHALNKGYDTAIVAAYAGLGLTVGTLLSVVYLVLAKLRFRPRTKALLNASLLQPTYQTVWTSLARLAVPMTLGASLVSVTKLIDMTMILRRLQSIGYSEVLANKAYGSYTTLALSIFSLLPTLLNAVALPLVPSLSAAIATNDKPRQIQMICASYRLTAIFAIPAALGISAFAKPVLSLLFGYNSEAVSTAAPLLSYLGVSVFLSCMITATNSVLHAYQVVNRPILSTMVGAVVKIISAYLLIGNPSIGLIGAPISTFLCNLCVVLLNLYFVSRLCNIPDVLSFFTRPLLASTPAIGIGFAIYQYYARKSEPGVLFTLLLFVGIALLYLLLACVTGTIRAEDVKSMPMGDLIYRNLKRLHLLKEDGSLERNRTVQDENN